MPPWQIRWLFCQLATIYVIIVLVCTICTKWCRICVLRTWRGSPVVVAQVVYVRVSLPSVFVQNSKQQTLQPDAAACVFMSKSEFKFLSTWDDKGLQALVPAKAW